MWRDVLIILAFVFAGLTYFGLTPRRVSVYAKAVKVEITKRSLAQKVNLFYLIAGTLAWVFVVIWKPGIFDLTDLLMGTACFGFAWCLILSKIWKLSERGDRVVRVVQYSVVLPLFVAGIIFSDMLLWQKLTYPLVGFGIGFGLRRLADYLHSKLQSIRSSEEEDE